MRSLVLALALGASALGVTAVPTNASAAPPRAARTAHYRANYYRARYVGHHRYRRPAVRAHYGRWYRPYAGCVPAPCR